MIHAASGTLIHGTLRTQDLLLAFSGALEALAEANREAGFVNHTCVRHGILAAVGQMVVRGEVKFVNEDENISLVDDLSDALNYYAPEGHYFGASEGDASDFGFWPYSAEDIAEKFA